MNRRLLHAAAAAAVLLPGATAHGEDVVTLRPRAPLYVGRKGVGMRHPQGVGCGSGPTLIVADSGNGRLLEYAVTGDTITPRAEIVVREAPFPIRAQVNSKGEIFVLDGRSRRIARLQPTGEFTGFVEPPDGAIDGKVVARSLAVDRDDDLYVLDIFAARVVVLDDRGGLRREIAFPESHGTLSDVAVAADGSVLVVDSSGRRVYIARKTDEVFAPLSDVLSDDLDFPTAIAVDPFGRIYVADQSGDGIVILGPDGSFRGRQLETGWKQGFLRYPAGLCVQGGDGLFVADRGNNRVQVFTLAQ